jgi:hypothetical protein
VGKKIVVAVTGVIEHGGDGNGDGVKPERNST